MDIKEKILKLVNSETKKYSIYHRIIKLITEMISDYLSSQNKTLELEFLSGNMRFDMLLPDGIDEDNRRTAIEIKLYCKNLNIIINTIKSISLNRGNISKVILLFVNEIEDNIKKSVLEKTSNLDFDFIIWDINDVVRIFQNNVYLFEKIYSDLDGYILRESINEGISRKSEINIKKREEYIEQLCEQYNRDNIVLFLGAGVSFDANIPKWENLISELYLELIDKELRKTSYTINANDKKIILDKVMNQNGYSPLIKTRYLRTGFGDEFEEKVSAILYKNSHESSILLEEIGNICIPNRRKVGIHAIVNYNFDDLVERNLDKLGLKYQSIYREGIIPNPDELGIYHVHGFLPENKEKYDNLSKSLLVFSEEGYHKLMTDPYNWANISQLDFMINNTCLFIGTSMTDPNLRRLLEIAAKKRSESDEDCHHYAIMRKFKFKESESSYSISNFENANEAMQELLFKEMGINIIWVNEYDEIPAIIRSIKE